MRPHILNISFLNARGKGTYLFPLLIEEHRELSHMNKNKQSVDLISVPLGTIFKIARVKS